jgi:hypothetical protein
MTHGAAFQQCRPCALCYTAPMSKLAERALLLLLLVIALALSLIAYRGSRHDRVPDTGTVYQSVALANGQLFFGRIEAAGEYVVVRDVFYLQTRQNPQTQAVANVLVKRGGEPHEPDHMAINRSQILLIEPVKPDSQVGRLIAEQNQAENKTPAKPGAAP